LIHHDNIEAKLNRLAVCGHILFELAKRYFEPEGDDLYHACRAFEDPSKTKKEAAKVADLERLCVELELEY
jgi:hypothetical protein